MCVFTASIFLKNGIGVPFVSLLCRNISFELGSKPKRNQETSSQKHMLSRGCCEIPLHSSEIYNCRKTGLEHGTSDQWILAIFIKYQTKKRRKTNRTAIENMIAIEKSLPEETKKICGVTLGKNLVK